MGTLSRYVVILAAVASLLACDEDPGRPTSVPGAAGPETSQLILALRDLGATAEVIDIVPQGSGLLAAPATRVQLNGATVFAFEFAGVSEADAEARRVPGILAVTRWMAPPHFFRGNRLIVLYLGTDTGVITPLQSLLGPQFAGQ
jgi:hypothetical protein